MDAFLGQMSGYLEMEMPRLYTAVFPYTSSYKYNPDSQATPHWLIGFLAL